MSALDFLDYLAATRWQGRMKLKQEERNSEIKIDEDDEGTSWVKRVKRERNRTSQAQCLAMFGNKSMAAEALLVSSIWGLVAAAVMEDWPSLGSLHCTIHCGIKSFDLVSVYFAVFLIAHLMDPNGILASVEEW